MMMLSRLATITLKWKIGLHKPCPLSVIKKSCRWCSTGQIPVPNVDLSYLCNDDNLSTIEANIQNRKGVGNIHAVRNLHSKWTLEKDTTKRRQLLSELISEAGEIPNQTHPNAPVGEETCAVEVSSHGEKREFDFKPKTVVDIGERLCQLRCYNTSATTGPRTYYFIDAFAKLERALVRYTLDRLLSKGFSLISVPDIVHASVIESTGFKTTGERTQVYKLDSKYKPELCLTGTAEMSLVSYLVNKNMTYENLPLRLVSASRCYRAETSNVMEEAGIYRVHQFTKVEMFVVSAAESGDESSQFFDEIIEIQKGLFSDLGLHFRILNMPTHELGAPAYCKYDFEAWMPAKEFWGEITSTSNCTDFQARRMHLTYLSPQTGGAVLCHTLNGTGCAVPRTIMAIVENFQNSDGTISIPKALRPYMNGVSVIKMADHVPRPRWLKSKKH